MIPEAFTQSVQQLIADCDSRSTTNDPCNSNADQLLLSPLETTTLQLLEEGMQLLSSIVFEAE